MSKISKIVATGLILATLAFGQPVKAEGSGYITLTSSDSDNIIRVNDDRKVTLTIHMVAAPGAYIKYWGIGGQYTAIHNEFRGAMVTTTETLIMRGSSDLSANNWTEYTVSFDQDILGIAGTQTQLTASMTDTAGNIYSTNLTFNIVSAIRNRPMTRQSVCHLTTSHTIQFSQSSCEINKNR